MRVFIVLAALMMGSCTLLATFRRLFARRAGLAWWSAFCLLLVAGIAMGYRLGVHFEYHVSPNLRVLGFPIPLCAYRFERGQRADFPSPDWFAYCAAFTNIILVTALAVLPVLVGSLFQHRKPRRLRRWR